MQVFISVKSQAGISCSEVLVGAKSRSVKREEFLKFDFNDIGSTCSLIIDHILCMFDVCVKYLYVIYM